MSGGFNFNASGATISGQALQATLANQALQASLTNQTTILNFIGVTTDPPTDPSAATGTMYSKFRGVGDNLDTLLIAAGANNDAGTDPSAATGTLFSKIRGAGTDLDTLINRQPTAVESVSEQAVTGTSSTFSAYRQLIASTAKASTLIQFAGTYHNTQGGVSYSQIQLASGGAGSEVVFATAYVATCVITLPVPTSFLILVNQVFPAGTRFAWRSWSDVATAGTITGVLNVSESI